MKKSADVTAEVYFETDISDAKLSGKNEHFDSYEHYSTGAVMGTHHLETDKVTVCASMNAS